MVDFTVPLLLDIIRTAGILVVIVYYVITIRANQRNQRIQLETRQAALFTQIFNKFGEVEFARNHSEVLQ